MTPKPTPFAPVLNAPTGSAPEDRPSRSSNRLGSAVPAVASRRRRQLARHPSVMDTPTPPNHASEAAQEPTELAPSGPPQSSGGPSPSAVPTPAYARTQSTHLGATMSTAAGHSQRGARKGEPKNSVRRDGIGGLIIAVVITHPVHLVELRGLFVPTCRHQVENGVRAHELLHAASVS